MEYVKKERIIEILEFHSSMIGVDSSEIDGLISALRFVKSKDRNLTIEERIDADLASMCEVLGYDKQYNVSRKIEHVAMRHSMSLLTYDRYNDYTRIFNVLGKFFEKDRSSGHAMVARAQERLEVKDKLFMYYYQGLVSKMIKK